MYTVESGEMPIPELVAKSKATMPINARIRRGSTL
jgi:hypothetical protein